MDRTACVDIPALPLQILLQKHPEWRGEDGSAGGALSKVAAPVVVVDEDRPQGLVLAIGEAAYRLGVRTGMRYTAALSLAPGLRAGVVTAAEVAESRAAILSVLFRFTPGIEPSPDDAGVFHLDASGLSRLLGPPEEWAQALQNELAASGFRARIAVGFTRFGVRAVAKNLARTPGGIVVFENGEDETETAKRTPLARLGIAPHLRDTLTKLGIETVGQFLALPVEGLLRRFGKDAAALRKFADGGLGVPLLRAAEMDPLFERVILEHPEADLTRLIFLIERMLVPLMARAAVAGIAVTEVSIAGELDRHAPIASSLRTAAPTLELRQIMDLVRLRLPAIRLPSGVSDLTVTVSGVVATAEQLRLFPARSDPLRGETTKSGTRRDPAAAERAFARLRAEFGDDAVVTARLTDGHLPEASFAWMPLHRAPSSPGVFAVASATPSRLVRRIFTKPRPLPHRPRHEPDGWLMRGPEDGTVVRVCGPFVVAGGWWASATGHEVRREYVFAETSRGHLFWAYADPRRRRWFLAGRIE